MQNQQTVRITTSKVLKGAAGNFLLFAPSAVCALMLLWAIEVHPLWFYTLTRWIVLLTCIWFFILTIDNEKLRNLGWAALAVAVLFNPVSPFQLARQTWQFMDVAAAAFIVASAASLKWATMTTLYRRVAIVFVVITTIYGVWRANDVRRPAPIRIHRVRL